MGISRLLVRFMQDVLHQGGGGGSAGAMQDENGLHEGEGGRTDGRTQVQDNTYIAAGFAFAQISDSGLI